MTTVALVVGLLLPIYSDPARHEHRSVDAGCQGAQHLRRQRHKLQGGGIGSFLLNIIPIDLIRRAVAQRRAAGAFLRILFGTGLALVGGEKGEKINEMIDAVSTVLFRVMGLNRAHCPARRARCGRLHRRQILASLAQAAAVAVALFYVSLAIFVLGVLGGVMALAGLNILKFLSYLREE